MVDDVHSSPTSVPAAIAVQGLRKRYAGGAVALAGLDLRVAAGTIRAVLGPNGSGKTTLVRILATLLAADSGRAEVLGFDVARQPEQVRASIGLTGQEASVDLVLSGRQNLVLFARLAHLPRRVASRRADELLERFGLGDAADRSVAQYSGGMRRRLDLAVSVITTPPVLFLDEPTTGLDPRSRNELWMIVRDLVREGTTVLLTTQYLEEADQLADRITVVDAGLAVAEGSADELKSAIGADRIEVVVRDLAELDRAVAVVARVASEAPVVDADRRRVGAAVGDRMVALTTLVHELRTERLDVEDIAVRRPTLDEVFLHLTSRAADEAAA